MVSDVGARLRLKYCGTKRAKRRWSSILAMPCWSTILPFEKCVQILDMIKQKISQFANPAAMSRQKCRQGNTASSLNYWYYAEYLAEYAEAESLLHSASVFLVLRAVHHTAAWRVNYHHWMVARPPSITHQCLRPRLVRKSGGNLGGTAQVGNAEMWALLEFQMMCLKLCTYVSKNWNHDKTCSLSLSPLSSPVFVQKPLPAIPSGSSIWMWIDEKYHCHF